MQIVIIISKGLDQVAWNWRAICHMCDDDDDDDDMHIHFMLFTRTCPEGLGTAEMRSRRSGGS